MEQRLVGLAFTSSSGVLTVNLPPNSNVAPPGYYMLFILNSAGVPSIASFVQVINSPKDQPPKGTITASSGTMTASSGGTMTIKAGQAVSFGATAYDTGGSVSGYSWYFPNGNPTISSVLNPGIVTFPTAGTSVTSLTTVETSLTTVDNVGLNDPSPPTLTITVNPAVIITNPTAGTIVNGIVQFQASVKGATGSSNTFTFMVDNSPLGNPQTTSGTSSIVNWNTKRYSHASHTLSVQVQDADGHVGTASESVTVH
jgi:hypothetical protein